MRTRVVRSVTALVAAGLFAGLATAAPSELGERRGEVNTVVVTVKEHDRGASLDASEFAVYRGERKQEIVDVKGPGEVPINLAVLIQDGLDQGVGHELDAIREFIERLPSGSKVMVGSLRGTHFAEAQSFTSDLESAARAVRLPLQTDEVGSAPFLNLIEALERFDGLEGRNQVVLVSNGLELNRDLLSASPEQNTDLRRAIREAQERSIPVWSIFANAAGRLGRSPVAIGYGQGSLNRLSDETGGQAFFSGSGFVTFDPALAAIRRSLDNQYVIAFRGDGRGAIEVTTESGVDLRHAH